MANTLTGLIPTIYKALDTVSRKLVGFVPAVFINAEAAKVAKDQTVTYPISGSMAAGDIAYGAGNGPATADHTFSTETMTIQKERDVKFTWNGSEQLALGSMQQVLLQYQFEQAMSTLVNEIETDLAATYIAASRAYGTAGTTPFQTAGDYTDASFVRKILVDNGAGESDLNMVIDTTAGAYIRGKQGQAQMAGTDSLQRQGVLLDISGMTIRESAQVKMHTKGTGTGYLADGAVSVGDTDIVVDTGSGTVVAGDAVTFADSGGHKYIVGTGIAAPGTLSVNAPGAVAGIATTKAMTIGAGYTANMVFHRMAIHLMTRLPPLPAGGDAAEDMIVITDPVSGLSFEVLVYRQTRQVTYTVGISWGVKVVKPEHCALLLG